RWRKGIARCCRGSLWSQGIDRALADVDCGDPERQRRPVDVGKSGMLHLVSQLLFDGEIRDGTRQIRIGAAMTAYQSADQRQNVVKVGLVKEPQQRPARCRELEDHESRARRQDPEYFAQ